MQAGYLYGVPVTAYSLNIGVLRLEWSRKSVLFNQLSLVLCT